MGSAQRLRFGIFEYHPASGELFRHGALLRLQAQPAQVLGLLLIRAGQVVTRADLKHAVWGQDTFVDFDRGLNYCIAQIRAALGDSPDSPVFVRTIPKRGYQFIAPVAAIGDAQPGNEPPLAQPSQAPPPAHQPRNVPRHMALRLLGLAALLFAIGSFILWGLSTGLLKRSTASPSQTPRVAVARFDNETGSPGFDLFADGLADSVTAKLTIAGDGRYGVIGNAAILRVPRDKRDLLAIGSSLNASYVVLAQVRRDSSGYFVLAHLIHLPEQTHLAVTELKCSPDDSLQAQSNLAGQIAARFSPYISAVPAASSPRLSN